MENNKNDKFFGVNKTAEVCTIWPTSAANQMGKMVEQCKITDNILATNGNIQGDSIIQGRAGFVTEEIHTETFNLEAILQDKKHKAWTGNYKASPLSSNNQITDIVITNGDGEIVVNIQSKAYGTPEKTATALRELNPDRSAKYGTNDQFVVPSDQVNETIGAAHKTKLKEQYNRPDVADAAANVEEKTSGTISFDNINSKPLTAKEAKRIAVDAKDGNNTAHKEIQNPYKNRSTMQQTARAAGMAAVITTVVAGTINTVQYLNKVQKGEMSTQDAFLAIMKNTAIAAGDSAIKAGASTAAVSTVVRFYPNLIQGSMFQSSLMTGAVAGTAICAADLVQCLVLVAAGKMTVNDLEDRTGKNIFQTGSGVFGSSIGAAIGAPAGPIGIVIGAIVGGMITSVAMTIAIENRIDKPYREILENIKKINENALLLDGLAYDFFKGQVIFTEIIKESLILDEKFNKQIANNRAIKAEMKKAIDNL